MKRSAKTRSARVRETPRMFSELPELCMGFFGMGFSLTVNGRIADLRSLGQHILLKHVE